MKKIMSNGVRLLFLFLVSFTLFICGMVSNIPVFVHDNGIKLEHIMFVITYLLFVISICVIWEHSLTDTIKLKPIFILKVFAISIIPKIIIDRIYLFFVEDMTTPPMGVYVIFYSIFILILIVLLMLCDKRITVKLNTNLIISSILVIVINAVYCVAVYRLFDFYYSKYDQELFETTTAYTNIRFILNFINVFASSLVGYIMITSARSICTLKEITTIKKSISKLRRALTLVIILTCALGYYFLCYFFSPTLVISNVKYLKTENSSELFLPYRFYVTEFIVSAKHDENTAFRYLNVKQQIYYDEKQISDFRYSFLSTSDWLIELLDSEKNAIACQAEQLIYFENDKIKIIKFDNIDKMPRNDFVIKQLESLINDGNIDIFEKTLDYMYKHDKEFIMRYIEQYYYYEDNEEENVSFIKSKYLKDICSKYITIRE